jgi:heat shock protein HslJ
MTGRGGALAALGTALLLVSCDGVTGPSDLAGAEWRLRTLEHPALGFFRPEDPSRFKLAFAEDGGLGITADCNVCGGAYSVSGGTLVVSEVFCTRVACPGAPVDQRFLEVLEGHSAVDVDGGQLRIASARGRLELTQ